MSESRPRRSPISALLLIVVGLLTLAAVLAIALGPKLLAREDSPPEATPGATPGALPDALEGPSADFARASAGGAWQAFDAGTAVFVDVRGPSSYAAAHIPGAISMPLDELEERLGELDPQAWIITYCTCPNEESSGRAARLLLDRGFVHVTPLLGGLGAWQDAGYPISSE